MKPIGVALAFIGVTMNFVTLCILSINTSALRKTIHKKKQYQHSLCYVEQGLVLTAFCVLTVSPIFSEHRMILMAFLGIAFVYLTDDLQTSFSLMFLTDESRFYINSATAKLLSSENQFPAVVSLYESGRFCYFRGATFSSLLSILEANRNHCYLLGGKIH